MNDENKNDELYKNREWSRNKSIAYFNSLNAAINLVTAQGVRFANNEEMMKQIEEYKTLFINRHDEYYRSTLMIGRLPFNPTEAIGKLQKAKNADELKKVWLNLSQDERSHAEVLKVKEELKAKYLNPESLTAPGSPVAPKVTKPRKPKVVPPSQESK